MPRSVVFGAGGFIGSHLVRELRAQGHFVIGVDRHLPRFQESAAHVFHIGDIQNPEWMLSRIRDPVDTVYQLCAFLGGSGIIDSKQYDADVFTNNLGVNLSVLRFCANRSVQRIFFASSACVYAEGSERISPVNVYGWEKLASERMYTSYGRETGTSIRIGRLSNVYGAYQEFRGGRERVISALCRKTVENDEVLPIVGNGRARRTFLHVSDCVRAIACLTDSTLEGPVNVGSSRGLSIDDLAGLILQHAGKSLRLTHTESSTTENVRLCDTRRMESLGWTEQMSLEDGVRETYDWIATSLATIS
jgi:nucleoside-diphosphate-sugar epimerase